MPILTVKNGKKEIRVDFKSGARLKDVLLENGFFVASPCGDKGICGKCAVSVIGDISEPSEREIELNCRLACQTILFSDAFVEIDSENYVFDYKNNDLKEKKSDFLGLGVAIDIGTTTVVVKLYDENGGCLGEASALNPQRSVSSDVLGRISASIDGKSDLLHDMITDCLKALVNALCEKANRTDNEIERAVISGNTAMLYLLTNRNPESISRYPFKAENLFGTWVNDKTYLTPCMNAFVGGDISCALLASGIFDSNKTSLLCDIGTNGEIALWKNGKLFVTSAAAGPAFEGAEISCGCQNIVGAVNKVTIENGKIVATTVGNRKAIGINGTGLVDAVASFLMLGYIDNTGYAERELIISSNGGSIELTQDDIRALQLAKAAIYAGIQTLLDETETDINSIDDFYIAGAFGSNLSIQSAVKIGLIPKELASKAKIIGNAALDGAEAILLDDSLIEKVEDIAKNSNPIELGGSESFYNKFIKAIDFE